MTDSGAEHTPLAAGVHPDRGVFVAWLIRREAFGERNAVGPDRLDFIEFVGIIVPHLVRLVVGADHRLVLPAAALFGATFLIACDLVARTVLAPVELPVGIVTAIIGGPVFLWLLFRSA